MINIVVIGGGTGSFTVLSGVKNLPNSMITAIVPSSDSGGSSGRLRDEFGYLPTGDVRQCLVALAKDSDDFWLLRELLSYRFDKGELGLKGHNLGNLLLTALTDIQGSELAAIASVQKLLRIEGNVLPVTLEKTDLVATYENGTEITGEHNIDEPAYPHDGHLRITNLRTAKPAKTHQAVLEAIRSADIIISGPGDLYTSLIANFVVDGVTEALKSSRAKFVYIVNLITKFGQTTGMSGSEHVNEITKYSGRSPDYVLINDNNLPADILRRYASENAYPVKDDLGESSAIIRRNLLSPETVVTKKGDVLKRSLIRHDNEKIAQVIQGLLKR